MPPSPQGCLDGPESAHQHYAYSSAFRRNAPGAVRTRFSLIPLLMLCPLPLQQLVRRPHMPHTATLINPCSSCQVVADLLMASGSLPCNTLL